MEQNTLTISEANKLSLVDNHQFKIGDYVYMNNYGEPYFATELQWLSQNPIDIGFTSNEYPEDCFCNNGNEWFTEFEIIPDNI